MNLKELGAPFPATDIEWRVQQSGVKQNGDAWAMCLAYVTNRAIMNRLDDVCGPENWKNHFKTGPDGGILCGISIKCGDEWVTKWDGAANTDFEAIKGGLSGAMKRAGSQWGIGRYLYKLDAGWARVDTNGAHRGTAYKNKQDQKNKQNPVYFKWNPPLLPEWALPLAEDMKKNPPIPEIPPSPPTPKPKPPKSKKDLPPGERLLNMKTSGYEDLLREAYLACGEDELATSEDLPIIKGVAKQRKVLESALKIMAKNAGAE